MKKIILLITFSISFSYLLHGSDYVPPNDTIVLSVEHVEGRWIEAKEDSPNNIYLFRKDSMFFKAIDNSELLLFNESGWYTLSNDTVKVIYQNMTGNISTKTKLKTMILKVIALSDEELNINKTENGQTNFIRLKRQNIK